eukprot:CAMPEP_0172802640 /NCGR_PEP_ID=MMETSP1075-20121228/4009_1 /TAXON_ID=2916 /ORGANISM="Ceratium fusus, Strain PA161109" /LENGTH=401 /DNA_ID=CAMNT_0013640949 /DNA_START=65 /DNA_END=1270 /DNA_ORIENTATION=+
MNLDSAISKVLGVDCSTQERESQCPQGHELQAWSARAGFCDGCRKPVEDGEQVMDCRWCDWYLCKGCLPVYQARGSSIWGAIASIPMYVADQMEHDVSSLIASTGLVSGLAGKSSRTAQSLASGTPQSRATSKLLADFCEHYPGIQDHSRGVPARAELESLWAKCSVMPPVPVAEAICEQLSWVADFTWPPKLRALCAIEYISTQGSEGKDVVELVATRAGKLLHRLTGVPQTKDKALDVIRSLRAIALDSAAKQQQQQQQQQNQQQHPQVQPPPMWQQQTQEATTTPKSDWSTSTSTDHLMQQPPLPAVDLMDLPIAVHASGHAANNILAVPVVTDFDPDRQSTLSWLSNSSVPSVACSRENTNNEPQPQTSADAANTESLKPAELLESLLHANAQRLGA